MGNLTDHFSGGGGGSNILEYIKFQADGRIITTQKGDVTTQNVTTVTKALTSWQNLPGSVFAYTPPDGTKYVSYKLLTSMYYVDTANIGHFSLALDGTRITKSQNSWYFGTNHYQDQWEATGIIQIDSSFTENIAEGKLSSWDSNKTLSISFRTYSGSYEYNANDGYYQNGGGSSGTARAYNPYVEIIAYK